MPITTTLNNHAPLIANKERQLLLKTIINTKNNKRNALYVQLRSPNVHNINESLNNEGVVQEGYSEDEVPLHGGGGGSKGGCYSVIVTGND